MKRKYLIAAVCCLALGITACSSKTAESSAADTAVTAEAKSAPEDSAKAEGTGKEQNSKKESGEEGNGEAGENAKETTAEAEAEKKIVTGQVEKVDKTVITISGHDDLEYQVDLKDAETRSSLEVGEGDEIQVIFLDDGGEVKQAESYDILTSAAIEGDMDPVIAGVIKDASMNSIVIEAASGKSYTFSTMIAQKVTGDKGIMIGENVEITYLGSLDQGIALRVITEEGSGDAEATYNSMLGTLVSDSDSAVTIQAADGSSFTFALGDGVDMESFEIGDELEITYSGSLTKQNAVAEDVDYQ
ncbi:MAG: hypothetical protein Q4E86_12945 [Lachnospiraceae bacterium]|nr:hypothetical protein [Lachnospiraceae bacterium]